MLSEIPACRGTAWWTKYVLQTVCDYLRQVVPCSFQWSHQRVSHQQLQSLSHGKTLQVAMTLIDHVFSTGSEPIFLENAHETFQLRIRIYTCHTAYTCTSTSECYTYRGGSSHAESFFHSWKKLDLEDTTKPPLLKSCHARSYTSDFVKQEGRCIVPSVGMRSPILSTNIRSHIATLTEGSRTLSLPCRPCSICTVMIHMHHPG